MTSANFRFASGPVRASSLPARLRTLREEPISSLPHILSLDRRLLRIALRLRRPDRADSLPPGGHSRAVARAIRARIAALTTGPRPRLMPPHSRMPIELPLQIPDHPPL